MSDKNDVVIIELDRPRVLKYGHKALKKLSALTGQSLDNMDMENFHAEDIEKVIYCGLLSDAKEHNENLKLEDMEDLLDQATRYSDILEKMNDAFNAAFGAVSGAEEEKN